MTKLSLNRVYTIQDCALLKETLRQQQSSLTVKIGFLERRIERHRKIIEKTLAERYVKQAVLDGYEQALTQAPPTDVTTKLKRDLAKSQVMVLEARLLRYNPVLLIKLENRLQIAETAVGIIDADLQELAGYEAQLARQTIAVPVPQAPETPVQPEFPPKVPAQPGPVMASGSEEAKALPVMPFSEKPFLTAAGGKQRRLPDVKNGPARPLVRRSSKPGPKASKRSRK
ncbi:hypothetical protein [Niabella sp.]|uniref:hypothetical protein n=1 Tax=Niabella sp. TaxID=1962976 RepID=UPI00261129F6|nr:hypothetical protein [Niabella sp.]